MSRAKTSLNSNVEGVVASENQEISVIRENKSSQNFMLSAISENKSKLNIWDWFIKINPYKNNATQR